MKLQALKILVVTMAFLILIGLGFLAYGIAAKFGDAEKGGTLVRNPLPLTLPVGAEIRETIMNGNRILMRLSMPDNLTQLIIFDMEEGREVQRIEVKNSR
ncbi:MAG: hypothetical protein VX941_08195 [Pseudomonadota bacterium]|nr:hypothetical protein [Pseudomonadota bacterium]